jgi:hypothetical protein
MSENLLLAVFVVVLVKEGTPPSVRWTFPEGFLL